MCENWYNFAQPWNNSFYYHYLQQHAIMSNHFQKLHSNIHYGGHPFDLYRPTNVHNEIDSCSSCSSCSCCSSGNCSGTSEYEEVEEMVCEEGSDEEQFDEDESECEYEFNVDVILAMRAAKEEIKRQEKLESKNEESLESKDEESLESNEESSETDEESSESKNEESPECKSDSTVFVDSDSDDFELVDASSGKLLSCNRYKGLGRINRTEDEFNRMYMMEMDYGEIREEVMRVEAAMSLRFQKLYDKKQPALWPVLPVLMV